MASSLSISNSYDGIQIAYWPLQMERALVIDDDQLMHYAISHALHPYFPEVKAVSNGNDALREISSCFYDVCFLDIFLPGLNGVPLLKKIREQSPDTKIVIMTGDSVDDALKKEIEGSFFSFLAKPFEISELKAVAKQAGSSGQTGEKWYAENRRSKRQVIDKTANYTVTVIELGNPISLPLKGDIIDLSESGLCLKTYYPLEPGHLLTFQSGLDHGESRKGIVRWSILTDDSYMYRVGIEFIEP